MAIGFSPTTAIISPHWWPCFLPAGGHESPHHQVSYFWCLGQGLDPFAGGCLREAVAV